MPMAVLEGMAYKNVTISTNVGGTPEIIENQQNGIIVEAGDKEGLYKNIKELIKDKVLREKLSNNAYYTIKEKFNIIQNVDEIVALYKTIYTEKIKR